MYEIGDIVDVKNLPKVSATIWGKSINIDLKEASRLIDIDLHNTSNSDYEYLVVYLEKDVSYEMDVNYYDIKDVIGKEECIKQMYDLLDYVRTEKGDEGIVIAVYEDGSDVNYDVLIEDGIGGFETTYVYESDIRKI